MQVASRLPALAVGAALAGTALLVLVAAGRPLATDDLWWHLKLGEIYALDAAEPDGTDRRPVSAD